MLCPVCGFEVANQRGLAYHFRHQSESHPPYKDWLEDQRWEGKVEGEDYVVCLVEGCGHRAGRLQGHLKARHGMSVALYQEEFPEALTRPSKVSKKHREAIKQWHTTADHSGTKEVQCPSCGQSQQMSKYVSLDVHETRCPECIEKGKREVLANLVEGEDYVTCQVCGYTAQSLVSHVRYEHPELEGKYKETFPEALMTSLSSAIRDKGALKGRELSDETRQLMSENAGRWNKGLTKETDERVARSAENMEGRGAWNKGLTAEDHPSIASTSKKLLELQEDRTWYREKIRIPKDAFSPYALPNGKIALGRAAAGLGFSFPTVKRECRRHGLPTFHRMVSQGVCLETVSKALGGSPYVEEWTHPEFVNPDTGRHFKFDGYFEAFGLVVEFHGHQHWQFPNWYHGEHEDEYLAGRARDRAKRRMVEGKQGLTFLCICEDEPFEDVDHIATRLAEVGILLEAP